MNLQDKTTKQKIDALIEEFSKDQDIISLVDQIESSVKTTKDHYGSYMSFLSKFDKPSRFIIGQAMIKISGNYNGINWALKILNGEIY